MAGRPMPEHSAQPIHTNGSSSHSPKSPRTVQRDVARGRNPRPGRRETSRRYPKRRSRGINGAWWMSLGLTVLAATVGVWLVLHYALESDIASRTPRPEIAAETEPAPASVPALPPLAATIVPVVSSIAPTAEPERLPWLPTPGPTAAPKPAVESVAAKPATKPGSPLVLQASVTPAAPISESALVTVSLALTNAGDPVEGAVCYANAYFRTLTARLPENGAVTGAAGRASFTIDARGATYDRHVPVEVTCRSRGGTASATTGFTPRRG